MKVHALRATGAVATQAPVPDAVSGQQVPWPLMAPAAERQEALILKYLSFHDAWQHPPPILNERPIMLIILHPIVHMTQYSIHAVQEGRHTPLSSAANCEDVWLLKDRV